MIKNKTTLSKLLQSNRFIMICSLIISFGIWFSLTMMYNPVSERVIKNVPVSFNMKNTAVAGLGLEVVSSKDAVKVDVRISGKTVDITGIKASDILVTPLLSNVNAAGEYHLSLVASKSNALFDFQVVSINPDKITVRFDTIATRSFPVTAKAIGVSATKGLIAENATLTDSANATIDITGAQTDLNKIASVVAIAEVDKTLSETKEFKANIVLFDSNGKEISQSNMALSFKTANITVAISKSKDLPIIATFLNAPNAYLKSPLKYSLSVDRLTVIGPVEIIDSLTEISLSPIDFSDISPGSKSFTRELIFPTSVKSYDNIKQVLVTLDLSGITAKNFSVSQFRPINVQNGMTAKSQTQLKNVKFVSTSAALQKINPKNIYIETDLTDYKAKGEYTVSARIKVDGVDNVWAVGDYKVIVTLS